MEPSTVNTVEGQLMEGISKFRKKVDDVRVGRARNVNLNGSEAGQLHRDIEALEQENIILSHKVRTLEAQLNKEKLKPSGPTEIKAMDGGTFK